MGNAYLWLKVIRQKVHIECGEKCRFHFQKKVMKQ